METINDFNGTVVYDCGINLLNKGNHIPANKLKFEHVEKKITKINKKKNGDLVFYFTDGTTDNHHLGKNETVADVINYFYKQNEAEYDFIDNRGEYYNFENVHFEGIAEDLTEAEHKVKTKLTEHCNEEIERIKKEILKLQQQLDMMKAYIEFAAK